MPVFRGSVGALLLFHILPRSMLRESLVSRFALLLYI